MRPLFFPTIVTCCFCPGLVTAATLFVESPKNAYEPEVLIFPSSVVPFTSLHEINSLNDLPNRRKLGSMLRANSSEENSLRENSMSILGPAPSKKYSQWLSSIIRSQRLISTGNFDQAMAAADKVIRGDSDIEQALLLRGVAKAGQGEHQEALADYDQASKHGLDSAALYQSRGVSLQALGRLDAAETEFTKAIARDPKLAQAYLKRGLLRGKAGKFEESIADFSKYIELRPNSPLGYKNRAIALIKLGRQADAQPDIIRAKKLLQK